MNFDKYEFRCSALSKLMTEPKSKEDKLAGNLAATTKEYLNSIFIREKYGRFEELSSKYLDKGNLVEQDSMDLFCKFHGVLILKNEESFSNGFIKGTPDMFFEEAVVDLKSSWSMFTFIKAEVTDAYLFQLLGYMWLTGKKEAILAYCLNNTPEHLIQDEIRKLGWKFPFIDTSQDPEFLAAEAQIRKNNEFDDINWEGRIKQFKVSYSDTFEETIKLKIVKAREYLNNLKL